MWLEDFLRAALTQRPTSFHGLGSTFGAFFFLFHERQGHRLVCGNPLKVYFSAWIDYGSTRIGEYGVGFKLLCCVIGAVSSLKLKIMEKKIRRSWLFCFIFSDFLWMEQHVKAQNPSLTPFWGVLCSWRCCWFTSICPTTVKARFIRAITAEGTPVFVSSALYILTGTKPGLNQD